VSVNLNSGVDLTIEKLIYGGDGLARMPADESGRSKTIFIPFVLPGEQVTAQLTEQKQAFSRARALSVVTPSSERTAPGCRYFGACGGCHYQHAKYEYQLKEKEFILRETLRRTARIEWDGPVEVHAAEPWQYRNRTRLHVRHSPFAIGYFRHNSHDLLPIEECPISSPLINRAIQVLAASGNIPRRVSEIELFANDDDSALLVEALINVEGSPIEQQELERFAESLRNHLPELRGVCAFGAGSDLFPWSKLVWASGATSLEYKVDETRYRVQAGSFFQVNRFLAEKLVELVCQETSGEVALDLFAGTGLFAVPLSRSFKKVIAVESARSSFEDLLSNASANVEAVQLPTEQFLRKRHITAPDLAVVDPPRSGLGAKVTPGLVQMSPRKIVYVSCDPATLARDLRVLKDAGYNIDELHMVDLFPQTYHLESVVKLSHP
jgi:23S rRNA (uracil1939-C5)-methyltransferase